MLELHYSMIQFLIKEYKPWNNSKQICPEQKTKNTFVLGRLCPVHEF